MTSPDCNASAWLAGKSRQRVGWSSMIARRWVGACLLAACAGGSGRARSPSAVRVATDSPMTTPSGATFTAPAGWVVRTAGAVVVLEPPDQAVSLTIVERGELDGEAAIAAAWRQVRPDFSRPVELVSSPPGRDGWDAATMVEYQRSADGRLAFARARRKGGTWYVMLGDGTDDGWVARYPGARIAMESFRARGVVEERFGGRAAHLLDRARLRELESFIRDGQREARVPGMAIAVVQRGAVVFERGFGVRELGRSEPVTPRTLFRIGSTSKALTSLMMAVLVDEGVFRWDTRATEVLPTFAVADAALTRRLTMGDLVCACSGIPYDNLGTELEFAAMSAEEAVARMKDLAPVAGYGETYQYSNAMLAAAGFLAAHALFPDQPMSAAYRRAMQTRVFDRLGMTSTTFDAAAAERAEHASPHDRTTDNQLATTAIAASGWTAPLEPAWGAWSSVHELAKVLLVELALGRIAGGGRLVSRGNLVARRAARGRAGDQQRYGLGLVLESYHGVQVIAHQGGLWGYSADFFFLPEHDVGAVVLWNVDYTTAFNSDVVRRKLFELLFDGRDEAREDLAYRVRTRDADFAQRMRGVEREPGHAWIAPLVGSYRNPLYGTITIGEENGHGVIDVGEWKSDLGRKRDADGTWKLVFTSPPWVTFGALIPRDAGGMRTLQLDAQTGPVVTFEPVRR